MHPRIKTALFAMVMALSISAVCIAADQMPILFLNEQAPGFNLNDATGKKTSLASFKGKNTVILAFWHPENALSITQLQELKKVVKDKKFAGVKVLAVTVGKEVAQRDAAKKKFRDTGLDFTIIFENREDTTSTNVQYQVWMLPAIYIVNKKGQLATPLISSVTEKIGARSFTDVLSSIESGKSIDACSFTPRHLTEDDSRKKVYAMIGKVVPNFTAVDVTGQKQAPSYYKGFKNLIIVFWSPGCPHCRRELPQISNYYNKFGGRQNVQVLAISLRGNANTKSQAMDFFKQFSIKYPLIVDDEGKIDPIFNINSVPTVFLVDKKGIIRDVYIGEAGMVADILSCNVGRM